MQLPMVKNTSPSSLSQSRASSHFLHLLGDQLWEYPFPSREEASLYTQAGLVPCGLKSYWLIPCCTLGHYTHGPPAQFLVCDRWSLGVNFPILSPSLHKYRFKQGQDLEIHFSEKAKDSPCGQIGIAREKGARPKC